MLALPTTSEVPELLPFLTPHERAEIDKLLTIPSDWRTFLNDRFAAYIPEDFAPHHVELWEWVWAIQKGERPHPFVAIWARGGAKSSSAEMATALVALRGTRKYILYVSGTQDNADKHVATIAAMLETVGVRRALNKYGVSKGWRHNRLTMQADGGTVTIDALGLDTQMRGIKFEEQRPDMMVLDDVDERHDKPEATKKKIETLTQSVLPAGSNDCAVLFVQNIIHKASIAAQLVSGAADFLLDRILSGPFPAIKDLKLDGRTIIGGAATWVGQSLEICQNQIVTWGLTAFLREAQHDVDQAENGVWKREFIDKYRVLRVPEGFNLERIVIGVDPPGKDRTECGIVANGSLTINGVVHIYTLEDASRAGTPDEWAQAVVTLYHKLKADCIAVETNFGGDMVKSNLHHVDANVPVKEVIASRGKQVRAEPMATLCQEGREHHVGMFTQLEDEQCNWVPGLPSPNRMDAHVWSMTELIDTRPARWGANPFAGYRG